MAARPGVGKGGGSQDNGPVLYCDGVVTQCQTPPSCALSGGGDVLARQLFFDMVLLNTK